MTDIVERLRSCLRFDEPNESESELEHCAREAADEITRLREENERLADELDATCRAKTKADRHLLVLALELASLKSERGSAA